MSRIEKIVLAHASQKHHNQQNLYDRQGFFDLPNKEPEKVRDGSWLKVSGF